MIASPNQQRRIIAVLTYMPHEFSAIVKACVDWGMRDCSCQWESTLNKSVPWKMFQPQKVAENIPDEAPKKASEKAPEKLVAQRPDLYLLVVQGSMGKAWAAARSQWILDHLSPDQLDGVIEFGSCGGLVENLKSGQIIFVNQVEEYDYDLGFSEKKPLFHIGPWAQPIVDALKNFHSIFEGKVASGDANVISRKSRLSLAAKYGAHAATWETAAFAKIISANRCHWASVRVVVDALPSDLSLDISSDTSSGSDPDEFLKNFKRTVKATLGPAAHSFIGALLLIFDDGATPLR